MWYKQAKIIDYVVIVGEKNIQQYIKSGMQPYGDPWFIGSNAYDPKNLHQVLVRTEDPIEAEVKTEKPKTK